MILAKLKEETREQHEGLEGQVDVMNSMFAMDDYKKLLTRFFRFYSSIEPRIAENDLAVHGLDLAERTKTPLIKRDLENLGMLDDVRDLYGSWSDLPEVDTAAKAFGCCYVLEGATLGGQVIMRHLKQHLDLTPENGGSFFNSYGERVGPMWKQFCAITTEFSEKNGDDEAIVNAAKATFDSFARCFAETSAAGR